MTELIFEYSKNPFNNEIIITARNAKFFFARTFTVNLNDSDFLSSVRYGIKNVRKEYDGYLTAQGQVFTHKIRDLNVMIDMANKGKRL